MNKDFFKKIDEIKQANDKIFNSISNKTETKNNIIFVYTPPKVGSIWIYDQELINKVQAYFKNTNKKKG